MAECNGEAIRMLEEELRYLKLLSKQYPTIASACTEIINLQAILNLPKGTEHFLSDIHGEYESFNHVLRNGSGNIKRKITEVYGDIMSEKEIKSLATLIYYPNTYLEEGTIIGNSCTLGPNTRIINSTLGNKVTVESSKVVESFIDDGTCVGPFAFLRPGTSLGKNVKIGDFVEVKKSRIGDNSKSSHLAYIGDAEVGQGVNIGCGVVFVNYDGKKKHKTIVGDKAFIGSNSNLIAPLTVEEGGYVAAGSTITEDVKKGDLAIARARQVNKEGKGRNRF
jgi:UDP-N-acetylglucosamine diphosphorylase/glucosamine-1-phosphate N-acetyltransferase